jgi:KipI family sensor histidine kinase inhibitor
VTEPPRIVPFGDAALLVVLGEVIDEGLNERVHRLAAALEIRLSSHAGWGRCVPAYASLLVPFDTLRMPGSEAESALAALLAELGPARAALDSDARTSSDTAGSVGRAIAEVPVRYGGDDGPDLDEVAERCGLRPADVVELHAGTTYRVFMLGFSPGFAYLGTLPEPLRLPRRTEPRPRVPAGSVAIAAEQTCIYPQQTPGGWHLIGRTELTLWDARADPPARLRPADRVRFVPLGG